MMRIFWRLWPFSARLWPPSGAVYVICAVFLGRIAYLAWLGYWQTEFWLVVPLTLILAFGLVRLLQRWRSA